MAIYTSTVGSSDHGAMTEKEQICRWLRLPADQWPADYYALLGLPRGESDLARIEANVQERLAMVRCYQLSHSEAATEAMNLIAEAYSCLCDPHAKSEYDARLGLSASTFGQRRKDGSVQPDQAVVNDDTVTRGLPTVVEWSGTAPPPVQRRGGDADEPVYEVPPVETETHVPPAAGANQANQTAPRSQPVDPILETAKKAWEARRGLWTFKALQQRVALTKALFAFWTRAGRYLHKPTIRLRRPAERRDFLYCLQRIDHLLDELPPLLGQPGQVGYRVAILARDEDPVQALSKMELDERTMLAQDWRISQTLLRTHLGFLRSEFQQRCGESFLCNGVRNLRALLNQHPAWVLSTLSLIFLLVVWLFWI